jgi:hypothetical protein
VQHRLAEQDAVRDFVDAVLALSDDPGPTNLQHYLAVSQKLEESRRRPAQRRGNRLLTSFEPEEHAA